MIGKTMLIIISVLALAAISCSLTVNLPNTRFKTGPTTTEDISISYPASAEDVAELTLEFGAGELKIEPGSGEELVAGTAKYNVEDLKPVVKANGNQVTISTGDMEFSGIPDFRGDKYVNEWNFGLGSAPMDLLIEAGAYKGDIELGGLSLASLKVVDGAADVNISFSGPNLIEMETLRYETGASSVTLEGLANANFEQMNFKGGAGSYVLDFSGELMRDATVNIDAGLSNVEIIVPDGVQARVLVDRGLANVDITGDWEKTGDDYELAGEGPRLTINVNIGAGNLELRNR